MKTIFSFFLLSFLGISFSMAQSKNIEKEMENFVAKYEKAYNRHDATTVAQLYTEDAKIIRFDDNVFSGSKHIETYFTQFFARMDAKNKISIDDIVTLPDGNAYITGHFDLEATVKESADEIQMKGTYSVLSKKINGDWKIQRMMLMMPTPPQG